MTSESQLESSNDNLRFPVITHDYYYDHHNDITSSSAYSISHHPSPFIMASSADDVESLSSMNESAWDVIDERSAASDNEMSNEMSNEISRIATPMSEIPEPVYPESESLAGNDTSSESPYLHNRAAKFTHSRKDSSSDPPDTARPFPSTAKPQGVPLENQPSYIKFREGESQEEQDVTFVLTEFDEAERKKLGKEYSLEDSDEVAVTVRQRMGPSGIAPSGPFRVVYVGPAEMKETVVNKIASALATSPGFSPRDSLSSSRVTVVPISSFADDSSPDVVLIDSMGIDMNIEECKSAKEVNKTITMVMTNGSTTTSTWDEGQKQSRLPVDYDIPDLAVIYVSQREQSATKLKRSIAKEFFKRHQVPQLAITYDAKWKKSSLVTDVDLRLPHLSLEAFKVDNDKVSIRTLKRQAIDINSFVSIDSAQLSRSLATIVPSTSKVSSILDSSQKLIAETPFIPTLKMPSKRTRRSTGSSVLKFGLILFSIFAILVLRKDQIFSSTTGSQIPSDTPQGELKASPPSVTVTSSVTVAVTQTIFPSPSASTQAVSQTPVKELLKDNLYQNRSDKFQAQVVGDNHVILRTPAWFSNLKHQPKLLVQVHRSDAPVPYELSVLFTGVYALKFPQEHAYGSLVIKLTTMARPTVNEIFHVELGNPWLKISGWQRAALSMKDHLSEDLFTARISLLKAYSHTNARVQYFFKDAVSKADSLMKEAEKISVSSFASTLQNTDHLLSQTKSFTASLTEKLRNAALSHTPALFSAQQDLFSHDLSAYSSKLSTMFIGQAKSLSNAASSLVTLGHDIQTYRETHFVNEQKRLLQTWWSIFGVPSHLQAKIDERSRQNYMDDAIWSSSRSARKAAKKALKKLDKKAEQQRKRGQLSPDTNSPAMKERWRQAINRMQEMRRDAEEHFSCDSHCCDF